MARGERNLGNNYILYSYKFISISAKLYENGDMQQKFQKSNL